MNIWFPLQIPLSPILTSRWILTNFTFQHSPRSRQILLLLELVSATQKRWNSEWSHFQKLAFNCRGKWIFHKPVLSEVLLAVYEVGCIKCFQYPWSDKSSPACFAVNKSTVGWRSNVKSFKKGVEKKPSFCTHKKFSLENIFCSCAILWLCLFIYSLFIFSELWLLKIPFQL